VGWCKHRTTASTSTPPSRHRYKRADKEVVTLTITDTGGAQASGSKSISVH